MITDQLLLFPELDPFKTFIRGVDYVDISTLNEDLTDEKRKHSYSLLPKGKFLIFKTGGFNTYRPKLGNTFPYIKNMERQSILECKLHRTYVRTSITLYTFKPTINLEFRLHRIAGEAFVINDDPKHKLVVDHKNRDRLDYRIDNLRWATYSENSRGTKRPRGETWEEKQIRAGKI
tara:strand:- start:48 stop:575 length:528 start_codon:yes stop_codon:yes gene_type:complete